MPDTQIFNSNMRQALDLVAGAISPAFVWGNTLEGYDFWSNLKTRLVQLSVGEINSSVWRRSIPVDNPVYNTWVQPDSRRNLEILVRRLPECFYYANMSEGEEFWEYIHNKFKGFLEELGEGTGEPIIAMPAIRPLFLSTRIRGSREQTPPKPNKKLGVKPDWYAKPRG